jgi:hypothetical protein
MDFEMKTLILSVSISQTTICMISKMLNPSQTYTSFGDGVAQPSNGTETNLFAYTHVATVLLIAPDFSNVSDYVQKHSREPRGISREQERWFLNNAREPYIQQ